MGIFQRIQDITLESLFSIKNSSDHLVKAWHHTYSLPIIISNCSNNYGPWQFPEKLIPKIIYNGLKGKEIPIYGNGSNIRDWLFVEDHIDALISLSKLGETGESYCIGVMKRDQIMRL